MSWAAARVCAAARAFVPAPLALLSMRYISTRGDATPKRFCDILLEGLAPDGGLYLPTHYPQVGAATLQQWRSLYREQGYAALAAALLPLYIDDIPVAEIQRLCQASYSAAVFGGDAAITPLQSLGAGLSLQNLSNGPTFAFKDMAMQLLGHLFAYILAQRNQRLNIVGATSGDTGSAAEYAMRGKAAVRVFMLSPQGRMSAFQQAQMYSLQDRNIVNLAVQGDFDTCQDMVKSVSQDRAFKQRYCIGTVNSINWARLVAQVVYYFAGYFLATRSNDQTVAFVVPSGNFGNICAAHVARMMGLPIARLVVATNENNVLDEFFQTGVYRVRSSAQTTSSPSMDISRASNFERFIFDLLGRDAQACSALFGQTLPLRGQFAVTGDVLQQISTRYAFGSGSSSHADRLATIARVYAEHGVMLDPHTADGVKVAWEQRAGLDSRIALVVMQTALPIKFAPMIQEALGVAPPCPPQYAALQHGPRRVQTVGSDVADLKNRIAHVCDHDD